MFEFLADQSVLLFFAIFVIFIIVAYKLFKFVFKAFLIGLVAAMFPVAGSLLFGLEIEITLFNILWFAVTGIGIFILYSIVKMGWKFLKLITSPVRWARRSGKHKKEVVVEKEKKKK